MATRREIGKRIRVAREEAGLSQEKLGKSLDPPRSHAAVSDMERGVTRVGAVALAQLAAILNKRTGFFFGEEPSPPREPSAFQARGAVGASPEAEDAIEGFKEMIRNLAEKEKNDGSP